MINFNKGAIYASIITTLAFNGLIYAFHSPKSLATVDITGITSHFIKEEAVKKHSSKEKEVAIKEFSHQLESALTKISKEKDLILVPKEAVIKGCPDYTKAVTKLVFKEGSI